MKTSILLLCTLLSFNFCLSQSDTMKNDVSDNFDSVLALVDNLNNTQVEADQKIINNQLQSIKFRKIVTKDLIYPEIFEGSGIEGTVVVEFDLTNDGIVESLIIRKKLHHSFDSIVINKIKNLDPQFLSQNFSPQKRMQIPIRFVIE